MRKIHNNHGYTLIELLTVLGIISVISTMVISVVFITLTGAKKSDAVEVMRQNGDQVLTQIVRSVRYAKSLDAPASCNPATTTSSITITSIESGLPTTYSCNANTISSNSASLLNTSAVITNSCSFTCSQTSLNDPPVITIQFTLKPTVAGQFAETKATLPFQSSVILRNYYR